jgi:hypothetical protein
VQRSTPPRLQALLPLLAATALSTAACATSTVDSPRPLNPANDQGPPPLALPDLDYQPTEAGFSEKLRFEKDEPRVLVDRESAMPLNAIRPMTPGSPPGATDERPLLQERLALFGAISFALGAAFYALGQAMVAAGREAPWPALAHAVMLANLAASAWTWTWCRRGPQSGLLLRVLDGVVTFVVGQTALVVLAVVIPEPDLANMVILLALSLALYSRTIFVPSSAGRTALVGVLTASPLAAYSILTEPLRLSVWKVAWLLAAVLISTAGSAVIYGLRHEVSRARRLGQYTLEEKMGEGGMGVVYRARHAMLRRPTAVKLLRPERAGEAALRRFEREVQLTASLAHPNTVAVFDFGRTPDGVFYYAMEYLAGLTLDEVVAGDGPQPAHRIATCCGRSSAPWPRPMRSASSTAT